MFYYERNTKKTFLFHLLCPTSALRAILNYLEPQTKEVLWSWLKEQTEMSNSKKKRKAFIRLVPGLIYIMKKQLYTIIKILLETSLIDDQQ